MIVIGGEDPHDFEQLRSELLEQYDPQSALEAELVERLAGISWRLRRAHFFEAAILDARQTQLERNSGGDFDDSESADAEEELSDVEWSVTVGDALIQDGCFGDALGKLSRYEASLMNAFTKTLQLLLLQHSSSVTRSESR